MGSIFRNLFRKKSKSGKSNTPGPHTPPIPIPNHPRPPPPFASASASASASTAAPPSALKKQHPPLAPVPEDGTMPVAAEPFPNHPDDDTRSFKLPTSPYTMTSAAASLRSIASVATLRPDPRAQLSSDDEFMTSDSDSASDTDEARKERERRRHKKDKKAGKKSKSSKKAGSSSSSSKKEGIEHPKAVRKAGSSASGSTASVSVAGSGSTRGSSSSSHHHQRSRQGSVASSHPHAHAHGNHHRPPTPPLASAYDGPSSSSASSSDDDNSAPVALDPVLLARARLGSASSTHLPFAHPPSRSASPALCAGAGAHYYQGYPSPGLTNSSTAGSRRGSPAGLVGLAAPAPLSPMHPNFHAHHATVAAQHQLVPAGCMSSPLAPGMVRPTAPANLAYAPLAAGGGGLRASPSMTSLHSAYAAGAGYPSRSASPMVSTAYHAHGAVAGAGGGAHHHPLLRASPSMTSLHSAYTAGSSRAQPVAAQPLGPGSRFVFPPTAGNTPTMSAVDLSFRGGAGVGGLSDSEEDEIIGLSAMRAGRGGYFLNGSAPGSPARSRAGSNASSVLTAGMASMSLTHAGVAVATAADEGGRREKKDKKGGGGNAKKKEKRDKEAKKRKKAAPADAADASVKHASKAKSAAPPAAAGTETFYGASPHLPQGAMPAFGPGTFVPFPSPASTSASSDQSSTGSSGKYRRAGGSGADARVAIGRATARGY